MTLFQRVRTVLAPEYEIREPLGRGGMGAVFLALDTGLDRLVAIKVLLPELATARAVGRFLREARALAAIEHPRVLRVYRAGEADGLFYYVMEYVEGPTLAKRLESGPLQAPELRPLATDLLDALAAIHRAGLIHRDVKPSNIFLREGRAVLGDFGIVRSSAPSPDDRITATGEVVGTPAYAAPEQGFGEATPATDLHAAAQVLYEAATGRWWYHAAAADAPWEGVPRRLRSALQRGLQHDPGDRWADADAFRAALDPRRGVGQAVLGAVAAMAVIGTLIYVIVDPPTPPADVADLAVLPFQVVGDDGEGHLGRDLATLTTLSLEGLPTLAVAPAARSANLGPAGAGSLPPQLRRRLTALYVARGTLWRRADRLELRLVVDDSVGERLPERVVAGPADDPVAMAEAVALALVESVQPRLAPSFRGLEALTTTSLPAVREFLLGENAFHRNAWGAAEGHYRQALALDSSFALAEWRLWNVWRWRLTGREVVDLDRLSREHGDEIGTVDRALLAAAALPPGPDRLGAYGGVARRFAYDGYARLLYGDELYHRGPLVGRSLSEAAAELAEAAARDPYLAPAYEHGLLAYLRLGDSARARVADARLRETAAPPAPGETLHLPTILHQVYLERFRPPEARARRAEALAFDDPAGRVALRGVLRLGLSLDVPRAQLELGERFTSGEDVPPSHRADGHTARGLALVVLGRVERALPQFDSAAALDRAPTAALEAAEWRVLLPALGVPGVPLPERARARAWLRRAADDAPELEGRAAWALAMDAYFRGEPRVADEWRRRLERAAGGDGGLGRLATLADAARALSRGQHQRTLALSEPLLRHQFLPRGGDPFARAALHVLRARAHEATGDAEAAARERLWADNQDVARTLEGSVQHAEVDWAISPYSDRRRARLVLARADTTEACRLLERVLRLWSDADATLAPARTGDARLHGSICS